MKIINLIIITLAFAISTYSQSNYSLRSSVFGNSSNTTGGDNYMIYSTVGQPVSAGSSTSNNYTINSGFWHTVMMITVPTFGDYSVTNVTGNSASFSIYVSANGASTTIHYEYGTTSGSYTQTFTEITGSPLVSGSATVSANVTGLEGETEYFMIAIARNSVGSVTSTEATFSTLSPEPLAHADFDWVNQGLNSISFTHTASNDESIQADGYLILRVDETFADGDYPVDGNAYSVDSEIGNATVVANITDNTSTLTILSGLPQETSWRFALVPYNWDGANNSSYNYLTDDAPTLTAYTIPTLGEWGLIVFGVLLIGFGIKKIRTS